MSEKKPKKQSFLTTLFKFLFTGRRKGDLDMFEEEQILSPGKTIAKEFFKRKLTIVGIIGFSVIFLMAMIVPIFMPVDLEDRDSGFLSAPPNFSMMRIPRDLRGELAYINPGPGYGIGIDNQGNARLWGMFFGTSEAVENMPEITGNVVYVSGGQEHAVAVTEDGRIYAWGFHNRATNHTEVPEHLQGRVVSATAGLRTTVVILDDGSVDVFGGVNHNRANIDPRRFPAHLEAYKVDIAWLSAGVMTTCGRVYVLSPALRPYRDIPEELYDIVQGNIIDFAMSNRVATVIVEGNRVYSWGDSTDIAVHVPDAIQGRAVQIRGGTDHFVALLDDGSLYAWGGNWNRQLRVPRGNDFVEVFSGYHHGYAMRADGSIETWGLNGFPFGSDHMGRCIFTRMWTAGRYSLTIGTVAIFIATFIGVTLGAIAGYFGGVVDNFIMRFGEAVGSIPFLPLALILNFHFGGDLPPVQALLVLMIVLGVLTWPPIMRLVRGQVLQARQTEYVLGARALGVKEGKIIARHILPNILSVIIVQFALGLAGSMLTESTLGFLGFGINEPTPTWGNMLNGSGSTVTLRYEWWRWVFPAAALVIATLSINLVGDGLREAIDPRTRGR